MADENEGADEGNNEGTKETPKQLRNKLETTLSENAELKGKLLIHEAGLGHLSEKQRKAAVRDASESGNELSPELLKASAKELGFPDAPKTEGENNSNGQEQGNDNGQGDGQGEGQPNPDDVPDPTAAEALNSMDAMDQAQRRAASTTVTVGSFQDRMNKAGSAAEVEAMIRSEGHRHGIVHEWDVE